MLIYGVGGVVMLSLLCAIIVYHCYNAIIVYCNFVSFVFLHVSVSVKDIGRPPSSKGKGITYVLLFITIMFVNLLFCLVADCNKWQNPIKDLLMARSV